MLPHRQTGSKGLPLAGPVHSPGLTSFSPGVPWAGNGHEVSSLSRVKRRQERPRMARRKTPDRMTAEEEIRSVLDWAQRTGHLNIAAALRRALAKWPEPVAAARKRLRS